MTEPNGTVFGFTVGDNFLIIIPVPSLLLFFKLNEFNNSSTLLIFFKYHWICLLYYPNRHHFQRFQLLVYIVLGKFNWLSNCKLTMLTKNNNLLILILFNYNNLEARLIANLAIKRISYLQLAGRFYANSLVTKS